MARALLRRAVWWAAARNLDLTLEVADHLRGAIALYERAGFRLIRTTQADWATPAGDPVTLQHYGYRAIR